MPKSPRVSGKEVIKVLVKKGFILKRQKGSHVVLRKENTAVVVPIHKELDTGTFLNILRQSGMKKDEFIELL